MTCRVPRKSLGVACIAVVGLLVGAASPVGAALDIDPPVSYGVPPSGDMIGLGGAINDAGMVVGSSDFFGDPDNHAYQFFSDAAPQPLGEPAGYTESSAWGLNASGVAVGVVLKDGVDPDVVHDAAIWAPASAPALLPAVATGDSYAFAINDAGTVVGGHSNETETVLSAVTWPSGGAPVVLDPLGNPIAQAIDINNSGVVVGFAGSVSGTAPMVWVPGDAPLTLPTLDGTEAVATGINDDGVVVGAAKTPGDAAIHLFRWTVAGGLEDLGAPPGGIPDVFLGELAGPLGPEVNSLGQITVIAGSSSVNGYVWADDDGFTKLPPLPGASDISYVLNLNNAGQVVGTAATGGAFSAAVWQIQQPDPPDPPTPDPPAPTPDPGPNFEGGGAGNPPMGGSNSGTGNTGTSSVPTLPATGPVTMPVFVVLAALLVVAGAAMTVGRRLSPTSAGRRGGTRS